MLGADRGGKKATPAQVALAWLLAQKPWIVPIPGHDEAAAPGRESRRASLELTAADLGEIGDEVSKITVEGERYPAQFGEPLVGR